MTRPGDRELSADVAEMEQKGIRAVSDSLRTMTADGVSVRVADEFESVVNVFCTVRRALLGFGLARDARLDGPLVPVRFVPVRDLNENFE